MDASQHRAARSGVRMSSPDMSEGRELPTPSPHNGAEVIRLRAARHTGRSTARHEKPTSGRPVPFGLPPSGDDAA